MDAIFVDDGMGNLGLNGEGQGTLRFDLAAYAGKPITLRLHDTSDVGVQWAGWWADDFKLADGATTLFSDDVENPPNGWTTNHFVIVPQTNTYPLYYMAEWRNNSGFDRGLKYPYQTVYIMTTTSGRSIAAPYTVPGMLLWLRNAAHDFDYTLSDSWYDPPSIGPKHALLVVDSHYWPMAWSNYTYASTGANVRISSRCQPANAPFTLQNHYAIHHPAGLRPDDPTGHGRTRRWRPRPSSPCRRCRSSTTRWATTPASGTAAPTRRPVLLAT